MGGLIAKVHIYINRMPEVMIDLNDNLMEQVSATVDAYGYDDPAKYVEDVLYRQLDGIGRVGRP